MVKRGMVKKRKRGKRRAVPKPPKVKHGFLEITAHVIGSTLGGMALKAGIAKSASIGKRQGKPLATQPKETAKQAKGKPRRPKGAVTNERPKV
jgi:hypothetical protein